MLMLLLLLLSSLLLLFLLLLLIAYSVALQFDVVINAGVLRLTGKSN
jgi:hypothetical protein